MRIEAFKDIGRLDRPQFDMLAVFEAIVNAVCPVPDKPWLTTNRQTMMDRRGEGVPIILENSKRLSGKEPEYRVFDRAELRLTIYAADNARAVSNAESNAD